MSFEILWSDDTVTARGEIADTQAIRLLFEGLRQTIDEGGTDRVQLDFGACANLTQAVMLPILPQIVRYREEHGAQFDLKLPDATGSSLESSLNDKFVRTNWAHFIQPEEFAALSEAQDRVPVRRYVNHSEMSDAINDLLRFLLRGRDIGRGTLKALEWSINEVTENVLTHAQSTVGGFVQASEDPSFIEFVVADAGIGIPGSLTMEDEKQALLEAVSEGGTRDRMSNAGNGLYGSRRISAVSHGEFEVHSLRAVLRSDSSLPEPHIREDQVSLPGTSVRCSIGRFDGQLLEEALRFDGETHQIASDYVERTFETDIGETLYAISQHAGRDLGSRRGGARVRQELRNLLRVQGQVVVDFAGVNVITSSFADEVFGRLFVELGPRAFMSRIVLRNVDPTIDGLIDRAIVQRTRLSEQQDR